jgi:integrase
LTVSQRVFAKSPTSAEPIVIQRPRKEKKLPSVLSEDEVALIFKQIKNLKHKCVIYLIYSAGLRRSEVLNLKPTDIDSKRNCIIIRDAKGKKDRVTLLSQKALSLLREYYKQYHPAQSASQFCHSSAGTGDGSAVYPGVAGAPKFQDNGNLYPHNEERISESEISSG